MNKIFLASLALMLGWGGNAFAQNEVDALRYTRLGVTGSARIQGIGGAQTALGADISTISSNPAGLGMFRRSEFSISPGLQLSSTDTKIGGLTATEDQNVLSIPHAGLVLSNRKDDDDISDWRGASLGISFTRLNNFNQRLSYQNTTEPPNTIVDYFADQANVNGRTESELDAEFGNYITLEGLAYGTYLINFVDEFGNPVSGVRPIYSLGTVDQREDIKRRGSQNQFDIGIGTSYKDKLYLGASLGILTTNFTQESIFRESGYYVDQYDETTGEVILDGDYSLELRDEFTTRGAGINLKVGVIARPVDALRLGLTLQTPTAYTFTDTYQRSLYATTVNPTSGAPETNSAIELPGEFTYNLTTPFRASAGVAGFIGKYGFVTADVEFVNYSNMRFSESGDDFGTVGEYFSSVNSRISDTYQSVVNYKFGAEGRFDIFRLRAGYAHSGDPYKNASFDGSINAVTLGAGVRLKNYYADMAYVRSNTESRYSPYTFSSGGGEPVVDIKEQQSTLMFTIGYNF
ncbi:OmpP1/FadL family transporter [Pontibacter sp. MBLB2868]|uniref:OmpP1/FadL family transporter n=1 Tax=Pontibacter sp. MBLB2868 TaxID=3451555 RepID=UPI003F74EA4D